MSDANRSCPLTQEQLLDRYYMDHRNHLLEIAAFLDRLDRAAAADAESDFRLVALRRSLAILREAEANRVHRVQMQLSDPRTDLLEERDQQGADGASPHAEGVQP